MASLAGLDDNTVVKIHKTAESPPRVSVIDVIHVITGTSCDDSSKLFRRLREAFPEVRTICPNFKFPGPGQRDTPVLSLLHGRAGVRRCWLRV